MANHFGLAGPMLLRCLTLPFRHFLFSWVDRFRVLALSYGLVGATVALNHFGISPLVQAIAGREVKSTAQTLLMRCSSGLGPIFVNAMVAQLAPGIHPDLSSIFLFAGALALRAALLILTRGPRPVGGL